MTLRARVRRRFEAVNGIHPMTADDDAYVSAWYAPLEEVARARGVAPDELRAAMLARRLPLPSYLRSDGAEMVPRDVFALVDRAGGLDALEAWFRAHWADEEQAGHEWQAYVDGRYVCLRAVSLETIRKDELVAAIEAALDGGPHDGLHALVDALDELEPPFAPYDRLRFGGPVSRDRLIDDVRQAYPRASLSATAPRITAPTPGSSVTSRFSEPSG